MSLYKYNSLQHRCTMFSLIYFSNNGNSHPCSQRLSNNPDSSKSTYMYISEPTTLSAILQYIPDNRATTWTHFVVDSRPLAHIQRSLPKIPPQSSAIGSTPIPWNRTSKRRLSHTHTQNYAERGNIDSTVVIDRSSSRANVKAVAERRFVAYNIYARNY